MKKPNDSRWMSLALGLAEKGKGWVSPNPMVGACLVKNNRLISSAFHAKFGAPHAEIEAIKKAGKKTKGATLYVTLEPCSTYGKTPPCTNSIVHAGIKKVVIGAVDPNPQHHGRGIKILKKNGILVKSGILTEKVSEQNESFFKWIQKRVPFVILKMAQSLDGKIASRTGSSRWISGPKARLWVHDLRSSVDAILVGKNTVFSDDPRLTVRNGKPVREPWRIVIDERGESPLKARIFRGGPSILACSESFFSKIAKKFKNTPIVILPLKKKYEKLDLNELLRHLGSLGITSLLVEGGGETAWNFLSEKLVDKIYWVIAPKIIGGKDAKTSVEGLGVDQLKRAPLIQMERSVQLGDDLILEGYLK